MSLPPYECNLDDPQMDSVDLLDANDVLLNRIASVTACSADWLCRAYEELNMYPNAALPLHWVETVWPALVAEEPGEEI
jgi:hypothetical protein